MADLTEIQASGSVKIAGATPSTGAEDNYLEVDASGRLTIKLNDGSGNSVVLGQTTMSSSLPVAIASDQSTLTVTNGSLGPVTPGVVATKSALIGGQFNTSLPTLTNTQQAAFQLDSSGRLIVSPLTNSSIVKAQLQDNAGTAIVLGQTTMSASVPVTLASNQSALPVSQSGSWTVTANAGTNLNTSALALDTSVNGILVSQGSTTSGEKGPLVQGAVTTAAPTYTTAQTSPLSLTTAGALRTDSSATTQPISGTVTANAGTGTFQVNVTNSTLAVTQSGTWNINNVSGTVSLPTGAATAANQSTEITSLQLIDNPVGPVGAGTSATNSFLIGGVFNTSLPTLTNTQQAAVQMDSSARVIIAPLTSASATKISDGTDTALVTTNGDQKVVDGLRNGGVFGALSIPTAGTAVEAKVGVSRLANRKFLQIYSNNNGLFYGLDNTVTTSSGIPLVNGQVVSFAIDPDSTFQVWLVGSTNTKSVQVLECP